MAVVQTTLSTASASVGKADVERETAVLALNAASAALTERDKRIVEAPLPEVESDILPGQRPGGTGESPVPPKN